jgi:hypothetical protein
MQEFKVRVFLSVVLLCLLGASTVRLDEKLNISDIGYNVDARVEIVAIDQQLAFFYVIAIIDILGLKLEGHLMNFLEVFIKSIKNNK